MKWYSRAARNVGKWRHEARRGVLESVGLSKAEARRMDRDMTYVNNKVNRAFTRGLKGGKRLLKDLYYSGRQGKGRVTTRIIKKPRRAAPDPDPGMRRYSRRYATRYAGSRRFKRGSVPSKSRFNTSGVVFHFEKAGVIDQNAVDNPAVIGHSTFYYRYLFNGFVYAIVRKLFKMSGYNVHSFLEKVAREDQTETVSPGSIRYAYSLTENSDPIVVTVAITANDNFANIAEDLKTSLEGLLDGSTNDAYHLKLYWIELVGPDVDSLRAARLLATDCTVSFLSTSTLRLQNRTLASSTAGDGNADSMLHVTNNPIVGKQYGNYCNGLQLKSIGGSGLAGTADAFTGRPDSGLIVPDLTTHESSTQNRLLHPPPAHLFVGRVTSRYAQVDPGQIKSSYLKTERTMPLNSFMYYMFNLLKGRGLTTAAPWVKTGQSRVFMFEKQLDCDAADEPEISIGYELNNTVGFLVNVKPAYCDPLMQRL